MATLTYHLCPLAMQLKQCHLPPTLHNASDPMTVSNYLPVESYVSSILFTETSTITTEWNYDQIEITILWVEELRLIIIGISKSYHHLHNYPN